MEKPKVFASPINKKINNSQEVYYERNNKERSYSSNTILKKINDIFNDSRHVYKSKVRITTVNEDIICDMVGQTSDSILTLDGISIKISDIKDIKKI